MSTHKDFQTDDSWQNLLKRLRRDFGDDLEMEGILFLVGINELGKGPQQLKKDQKIDVLHIAICTLLEPYGYYVFKGRDEEGWPYWDRSEKLPYLHNEEQERLIKESLVEYFQDR